jgi:drug/metabolite transporter (DMT)-like permease
MQRLSSPAALLAIAVLTYGFSNALVRNFAVDRTGLELAFWLAAATITGILASHGKRARSDLRLGNTQTALPFICFQGAAFLTFVLAMDLAPAAQVGAILPLEGIVAAGFAALIFKERIGKIEVVCIGCSALGAALMARAAASGEVGNLLGLLFALTSASLYGAAMLAVLPAALSNKTGALTFWACVPVFVICAPFGLSAIGSDTLTLFAISCFIKPVADLTYTAGIARAPIALASSTLPMIGMATAGFAWVLMGEAPGPQAAIAATIIAACSVVLVLQQARSQASS